MINYLPSIILSVMRSDIFKLIFEPTDFSKIHYHAALELRASLIKVLKYKRKYTKGRAIIIKKYKINVIAKQYENLFNSVLDNKI